MRSYDTKTTVIQELGQSITVTAVIEKSTQEIAAIANYYHKDCFAIVKFVAPQSFTIHIADCSNPALLLENFSSIVLDLFLTHSSCRDIPTLKIEQLETLHNYSLQN